MGWLRSTAVPTVGRTAFYRRSPQRFRGGESAPFVGGLHLFRSTEQEVRALAKRLRDMGITALYTGHCTGERAIALLREELGDGVQQFYSGMEIQID